MGEINVEKYLKGLNLRSGNYEILNFLIKDEDDYELFMRDFWESKQGGEMVAVNNFRQYKVKQKYMSKEEFLREFEINPKSVLEKKCQHSITNASIKKIEKDKVQPDILFDRIVENPAHMLPYFLLRRS